MRDMKPSLIAGVTVGLYNPTETWLRKTVSRYSGAFSIIVQMYAEYLMNKFLSISEKHYGMCKHWHGGKVGLSGYH